MRFTGCGLGSGASHGREGGESPRIFQRLSGQLRFLGAYEQALREVSEVFNHGSAPWHSMGQESVFASSYTLVVANEPLTTAHTWLDQLRALPTVTSVQANYIPAC